MDSYLNHSSPSSTSDNNDNKDESATPFNKAASGKDDLAPMFDPKTSELMAKSSKLPMPSSELTKDSDSADAWSKMCQVKASSSAKIDSFDARAGGAGYGEFEKKDSTIGGGGGYFAMKDGQGMVMVEGIEPKSAALTSALNTYLAKEPPRTGMMKTSYAEIGTAATKTQVKAAGGRVATSPTMAAVSGGPTSVLRQYRQPAPPGPSMARQPPPTPPPPTSPSKSVQPESSSGGGPEVVMDDFKPEKRPDGRINLLNPYLDKLASDHLMHLGLNIRNDLEKQFGDLKFIVIGGTGARMRDMARSMVREVFADSVQMQDLARYSPRFPFFKVSSVLVVAHGLGCPSMTILLHELFKLVHYAKCTDVKFIRMGMSHGVNIPSGSVVIANKVVDEFLNPYQEMRIMGKVIRRPADLDDEMVKDLKQVADGQKSLYDTLVGTTMCTSDLYESQARMDGAICRFTPEERNRFLEKLSQSNVLDLEMESLAFGAMCRYVGIPAAVVNATLTNRSEGDRSDLSPEDIDRTQKRASRLVMDYIKKKTPSVPPPQSTVPATPPPPPPPPPSPMAGGKHQQPQINSADPSANKNKTMKQCKKVKAKTKKSKFRKKKE